MTKPLDQRAKLGLPSGIGLVLSSMIGAGVFLSAGFMAQDLSAGLILLTWVAGLILALLGVAVYAAVAARVPRSGGEYRYLSDLLHPAFGYLAGWASFLVGFSAPIAINALAAEAFLGTLFPLPPHGLVAAALVVGLTAAHALDLKASRFTQDALALAKALLVALFVALGLVLGSNAWPDWAPPNASASFPTSAFARSLFFVGFAFSGWNAAIYAAGEFANPRRDVGRSMWIGCLLVGGLYLLVNWVFVANLDPGAASAVFRYEQDHVTLGHLVAERLLGTPGGVAMSILAVLAFVSAMSTMIFSGPRVYAAMAQDGYLPRWLAGGEGRPPLWSVVLQGALALLLLFTHQLQQVLQNVGGILTLFSALVALALIRRAFQRSQPDRPGPFAVTAAALYILCAGWMLYFGFSDEPKLVLWIGVVAAAATGAYALTARARRRARSSTDR
ncbi:MAG: amino acid permease [Myxococcales bacterium]|nr:amino acid permease [Myxococcales bacterium]